MKQQLLDQYKDHFILLCEAGFIAVNQADEDAALKLFKASELLKPENTLSRIGLGYLHLMKLEVKQAYKIFEEALEKEPNNEMAKAFLGLSLIFTPNEISRGEKILEESATQSKDSAVKNLASSALTFVQKFVKQQPGPAGKSEKPKEKKNPKK